MKFAGFNILALALPTALAGVIRPRANDTDADAVTAVSETDAAMWLSDTADVSVQSFDDVIGWLDGFRCVSSRTKISS